MISIQYYHISAIALTPEIDLREEGNISAEMIQGKPFVPKL